MQSPFNRGGFSCFSDTPSGMPPGGRGTAAGGGVLTGADGSPTHGPLASSSATPNSAWNFGR